MINLFKIKDGRLSSLKFFTLAICASLIFCIYFFNYQSNEDANIKDIEINKLKLDFNNAFLKYTHPLQGLVSGIHLAKLSFSKDDFRRAAESRDFYKNFEGSLGVGFIRKINSKNLASYNKNNLKIKRLNTNKISEYFYVIENIEPFEINKQAIGLVISDEENRLNAANEAMRTGNPAITYPIQLVQSTSKEPGFLLLLPLYTSPNLPDDILSKEQSLIGWAYSPIRLNPIKAYIEKQNPHFKIESIYMIKEKNSAIKIENMSKDSAINVTDEIFIDSVINKNWMLKVKYQNPTLFPAIFKSMALFAICFLLSIIIYFILREFEEKEKYQLKLLFETKQKVDEATKELSRQKDFLQKTIDIIPAQIGYWDNKLVNILANKGYYEDYHITNKTIHGMHVKELLGEEFNFRYSKIQSVLNGHIEEFERNLIKDGKEFTYQVHYIPDFISSKVVGFFSIVYDISELKNLQRKEKDQQALLYSKSRLSLLGEMASGIAHEINNPLAIIKANCRNALKISQSSNQIIEKESLNKIEEKLKTIDRTVDRAADIIKGMRSISRDSSNDPKVDSNLSDITNNILNLNKEKLNLKNIQFEIIYQTSIEQIPCNKVQIEQVLLNLLSNSIFEVEKLNYKWIKLIISEEADHILFRLVDSGTGIPAEIVDKLFVPFYTTKPVGQGTGIGLNISKNLIENHGGKFYYDFFEGHTSFVAALPTKDQKNKAS